MAAPKWHIERLRELLHREIGTVIAQEVRDPRIPDIVTVTEVKLAKDVRNATVYVSVMGSDDEKAEAIDALNKAAPFIKRIVASRVVTKNFPQMLFKIDASIEYGQRIDTLIRTIQSDLKPEGGDGVISQHDDNQQESAG
jgi:ribosome-binding factor A